eukprot:365353-Chlamydomonas_euryale.AAC.15
MHAHLGLDQARAVPHAALLWDDSCRPDAIFRASSYSAIGRAPPAAAWPRWAAARCRAPRASARQRAPQRRPRAPRGPRALSAPQPRCRWRPGAAAAAAQRIAAWRSRPVRPVRQTPAPGRSGSAAAACAAPHLAPHAAPARSCLPQVRPCHALQLSPAPPAPPPAPTPAASTALRPAIPPASLAARSRPRRRRVRPATAPPGAGTSRHMPPESATPQIRTR